MSLNSLLSQLQLEDQESDVPPYQYVNVFKVSWPFLLLCILFTHLEQT